MNSIVCVILCITCSMVSFVFGVIVGAKAMLYRIETEVKKELEDNEKKMIDKLFRRV